MKARLMHVALAAALALGAFNAAAADTHAHEAGASKALKLNVGKKWQTDAPLRKGMEEIRSAVAADKAALHAGKMTPAAYDILAKKIDGQVAYMVKNCKLPPEADAQLHLVIADLMQASEAMKGKGGKVTRKAGVEKVVAALAAYAKHFDHPGWRPLG